MHDRLGKLPWVTLEPWANSCRSASSHAVLDCLSVLQAANRKACLTALNMDLVLIPLMARSNDYLSIVNAVLD